MTQDAISTHLLTAILSSPLGLSLFLPARRCAFKHRLVTQVDQIEQCADCLETPILLSCSPHQVFKPLRYPLPTPPHLSRPPTHWLRPVNSFPSHLSAVAAAHLSPSWRSCVSMGKPAGPQTAFWPAPATSLWGSSCRWEGGTSEPGRQTSEGSSEPGRRQQRNKTMGSSSPLQMCTRWHKNQKDVLDKKKSQSCVASPPSSDGAPSPALHTAPGTSRPLWREAHTHTHTHKSVRGCCHLCPKKLRDGGGTCQPVGPEDAEAGGKEREGVDEVHAEVEDALQQHHQQAQLR